MKKKFMVELNNKSKIIIGSFIGAFIILIGGFLISGNLTFDDLTPKFLDGFVSASSEDKNVKGYDKETKTITIKDKDSLQLAEYALTYNTNNCLTDCYAEGTATLYSKDQLFSDLKFKDTKDKWVDIERSQIYIQVEEVYEFDILEFPEVCIIMKGEICVDEPIGKHQEEGTRLAWKEYKGELLEPGIYNWRIEGTKDKNKSIDWIATSFGEDFTEWAWWSGAFSTKMNITGMNVSIVLPINSTGYTPIGTDDSLIYGACGGDGCALYYNDSSINAIASDSTEYYKVQTRTDGVTDLINFNVTGTAPTNLKLFMPFDNNHSWAPIDFVSGSRGSFIGSSYNLGLDFGGANYWGGALIGTNTRVQLTGASAFSGAQGTVIVKFQADSACGAGAGKRFINSAGDSYTMTTADNSLYYMVGGTYVFEGVACSAFWSTGDWVYLVFTWDTVADTHYVYVNNVLKASSTKAASSTSPNTLCIGGSCAGGAGDWNITHLEIYNKVLTSGERAEHYARLTSLSAAESEAPADTCTYSSGIWEVNCADYCNITSDVNMGAETIVLAGTGGFTIQANITADRLAIAPTCILNNVPGDGNELRIVG